ncbi:transglutaminase-like cysteine peptidase [Bosea sp. ASV33]|uniref:transglutaminase-like cysteine peptidase n=1 Tax=Bosea sp. ASV33 TaxID=2795106 RepID=UPI0018EBCD59|nr:transglutaminase-like cysteine peptidase [Bosea sp. ASV33]
MKNAVLGIALGLAVTAGAARAANVVEQASARTDSGRIASYSFTLAPLPFVKFCMNNATECQPVAGSDEPTAAMLVRMEEINREVNRGISPKRKPTEPLLTNWTVAPGTGDCNDYAVTKRHRLIAAGWPSSRVLLAAVVTSEGQGHLVVVARTAAGDLVLDNLTDSVKAWNKTSFDWISMQSEDNPRFWVAVGERGRLRQQRLQALADGASISR